MNRPQDDIEARIRKFRVRAGRRMHDRTLRDALAAQAATGAVPARKGRNIMRTIKRLTPMAAAACVAGAVVLAAILGIDGTGSTIAFADVRQQIQEAQTLVFDWTYVPTGDAEPVVVGKAMFKAPHLTRYTVTDGAGSGTTVILDERQKKLISLNSADKRAVLIDFGAMAKNAPDVFPQDLGQSDIGARIVSVFRQLVEGSDEALGEKVIEGRKAVGFRATHLGNSVEIWADAQSGDLLEADIHTGPQDARVRMRNIRVNSALDDSLFSLTPPDDYELMPSPMPSLADVIGLVRAGIPGDREKDLTEGLKLYARCNRGVFPAEPKKGDLKFIVGLSAKGKYVLSINNHAIASGRLDEVKDKGIEAFGAMTRCRSAVVALKKSGTWKYVGEGVKLGSADEPVCWYRLEGFETYRVVYGDCSIKDVKSQDLPQEPAPEK